MARSSSLHGRLAAVLSEKHNRRSVSTFAVAACVLLGATILIPVAMLGAVDENQTAQEATPPTADLATVPATASEGSAEKLQPGIEEHLDWSEPVNGLRAAVRIRTTDSPGILGKERRIFLVLQNVSDKPTRFCDITMSGGDALKDDIDRRKLYHRRSEVILFALSSADSTQTDVTLQPREVVELDLFRSEDSNERVPKVGDSIAAGIMKYPTYNVYATLNLSHARQRPRLLPAQSPA